MRYGTHYRSSSSRDGMTPFIRWAIIGVVIIGIIFLLKSVIGKTEAVVDPLALTISGSGSIVVTDSEGKKRDIVGEGETFAPSDTLFSVISGTALLERMGFKLWVDKGSDIDYITADSTGATLKLIQGRTWTEMDNSTQIELKHINATLAPNSVALIEQQRVHSIVYMIRGNAKISASGGQEYTLEAGNRIMVSQSDLVNPGASLAKLAGEIPDSIKQNAFFLAHNGEEILRMNTPTGSGGIISSSGALAVLSATGVTGKYISIIKPLDGSVITGNSFSLEGTTSSPLIKKVLINDKEVVFTKTDTFVLNNVVMTTDTLDLVYKAYDASSNMLERGIITVYSSEKKPTSNTLVPTTFPVSDKDFRILSPAENPYKTTLSSVTVSGSVPKGVVQYIVVNNFRLQKFAEFSTNWYYYANMSYSTMKEGFNLYEIKFYGANDTLLYTQLFTIIKEGDSLTLSGE